MLAGVQAVDKRVYPALLALLVCSCRSAFVANKKTFAPAASLSSQIKRHSLMNLLFYSRLRSSTRFCSCRCTFAAKRCLAGKHFQDSLGIIPFNKSHLKNKETKPEIRLCLHLEPPPVLRVFSFHNPSFILKERNLSGKFFRTQRSRQEHVLAAEGHPLIMEAFI